MIYDLCSGQVSPQPTAVKAENWCGWALVTVRLEALPNVIITSKACTQKTKNVFFGVLGIKTTSVSTKASNHCTQRSGGSFFPPRGTGAFRVREGSNHFLKDILWIVYDYRRSSSNFILGVNQVYFSDPRCRDISPQESQIPDKTIKAMVHGVVKT